MNDKGTNIFSMFVLIIVGVVLFVVIVNTIQENVTPMPIVNETGVIGSTDDNTTALTLANDEIVSGSLTVRNNTENIDLANFTINYESGTIAFNTDNSITAVDVANLSSCNMTYTYETDNYIEDSTSRTITKQLPLFFAIAILLFVIAYVWKGYGKDWIDM